MISEMEWYFDYCQVVSPVWSNYFIANYYFIFQLRNDLIKTVYIQVMNDL